MKPATMIAWATCATALAATTAAVAKVFSRTANGALADFWMRDGGTADVAVGNNFTDKGTWWLSDRGYCTKWQKIRDGEERCFTVRNRLGQVQVFNPDGSLNSTIIRVQ